MFAGGCFGYVPRLRSSRHDGWDPSTQLSCHHTWRDTFRKKSEACKHRWISPPLKGVNKDWYQNHHFWHSPSILSIVSFLRAISLLASLRSKILASLAGPKVMEPCTQSWCIRLPLSFCFRFLVSHLKKTVRFFSTWIIHVGTYYSPWSIGVSLNMRFYSKMDLSLLISKLTKDFFPPWIVAIVYIYCLTRLTIPNHVIANFTYHAMSCHMSKVIDMPSLHYIDRYLARSWCWSLCFDTLFHYHSNITYYCI